VKAVFFDAGGTLVHIDHARVASAIRTTLGREVGEDALVAAEYAGRDAIERAMADGTGGTDASRWTLHFRSMLGALGVSDAEFASVAPAIVSEHKRLHLWSRTAPGTAAALAALGRAGWLVACISNADGTVEDLLARVGLREHLAFVVDSGVVGVEKPDPGIFEIALRRSGMSASESYYVGDLFPVDVVGAQGAGMVPVLLDPLGRYRERGCRTTPDVPAFCRELVSAAAAA